MAVVLSSFYFSADVGLRDPKGMLSSIAGFAGVYLRIQTVLFLC